MAGARKTSFLTRRIYCILSSSHPCSDIEGVDMISPRQSVNIIEPSFLQDWGDHDNNLRVM
jgi:hypothetical protein